MFLLKNAVNGRTGFFYVNSFKKNVKSFYSIDVLYNKTCLFDEALVAVETIVLLFLEINLSY